MQAIFGVAKLEGSGSGERLDYQSALLPRVSMWVKLP